VSWVVTRKIGAALACSLICVGTAWAAASDPTITLSLTTLDQFATVLEALIATAVACGGFFVYIVKTRNARAKAVTQEIEMAIEREKTEREEDVQSLEQGIAKLSDDFENLRSTCARADDVTNLYRLVEKVADRSDAQHQILRDQMAGMASALTTRLDRLAERRGAGREVE
jgi:hypothetical protein